MKYKNSLQALIAANKREYATHTLVTILFILGIKSAGHPTLGDVRDFIDKVEERRYLALLEIYSEPSA